MNFMKIMGGGQLENRDYRIKIDDFTDGLYVYTLGFIKKILIANVLGHITQEIFAINLNEATSSILWLGSICYSLQLYYDFSGYSDMAIGIGKIFGFNCKQNFNYPYMTKSISEFWRRWHISLGSWFKDYVYFPLGGSRVKSKMKLYFNLLVVWLLTGIWHGANWNFILWGFIFFIFIALEKTFNIPQKLNKLGSILYRIFCLFIINIQWVLFNSSTIKNALKYILRMFSKKGDAIYNHRAGVLLSEYWLFILIAIIFSMPVLPWLNNLKKKSKILEIIIDLLMVLIIVLCFIWAVTFIIAGQNNPFMYANF